MFLLTNSSLLLMICLSADTVLSVLGDEQDCMKRHNDVKAFDAEDGREDKCFLACFMKEKEIMNQNGDLLQENMLNYFKQAGGSSQCIETIVHCVQTVMKESDECETAYSFDSCITEQNPLCGSESK